MADVGLYGLAVMGQNFALNMASKGFSVSVCNRSHDKVRLQGGLYPIGEAVAVLVLRQCPRVYGTGGHHRGARPGGGQPSAQGVQGRE